MPKLLEPGDMLPTRRLTPLGGGDPVRVGPNRTRTQVLVIAHREPCRDCADYVGSFDLVNERVRAENAEVLAVVGPDWDPSDPALPVRALVDDGGLADRLSDDRTPVVAVADRYGQLFHRFDAGAEHHFPDHDRLLHHLLDIALRCPECGVPDIPTGMVLPEADTRSGGIHAHQ